MSIIADIQVLFCDDALLVINKPAGLLTLPDGYNPSMPHIKSVFEPQLGRLWIVHRLDKETSGVLLLPRSAEAHRSLNTQFEQRLISKIYHALVIGSPAWREQIVDLPLRPNGDRSHRTVIDTQRGKPATTHFRVVERFPGYCLLEAKPETGRTHQIRTHLLSMGLPILGDRLYNRLVTKNHESIVTSPHLEHDIIMWPKQSIGLHAKSLEIRHPVTDEQMKFIAPYPGYFEAVLLQLRGN
jgi:RluA family pseudouridine synthase